MDWARVLAFVTGMVDQELLARIEYLAAENHILKGPVEGAAEALGRVNRRLLSGDSCNRSRPRPA
jgi:hypothetical protein